MHSSHAQVGFLPASGPHSSSHAHPSNSLLSLLSGPPKSSASQAGATVGQGAPAPAPASQEPLPIAIPGGTGTLGGGWGLCW